MVQLKSYCDLPSVQATKQTTNVILLEIKGVKTVLFFRCSHTNWDVLYYPRVGAPLTYKPSIAKNTDYFFSRTF